MKRANILIHGMVQGVFFRAFTKRTAELFGINGFVQNLPDGSVEAVAEGPDELLDKFISRLRKGPLTASVQKVNVTKTEATGKFKRFEIR